jgi:hypothetical protein
MHPKYKTAMGRIERLQLSLDLNLNPNPNLSQSWNLCLNHCLDPRLNSTQVLVMNSV